MNTLHFVIIAVVLDAGCGPGRLTIPAAQPIGSQGELTALDLQSDMLARMQEKPQTAGLSNIRFIQSGLGDGKWEKNYYDFALMVTVWGEIPEKEAALKEIFQSLKPDGILSVTDVIFDPHFSGRAAVQRAADIVGFREVDFFGKRLAYIMHFEKKRKVPIHRDLEIEVTNVLQNYS